MHRPTSPAVAALLLCGLPSIASAQEYCVNCTGPDVTYRCVIGGDPGQAARSSRGQLLCITELAKSGGHASCSVSRSTAGPCEGKLKMVMFPEGEDLTLPPVADAPPGLVPPSPESPQPAEPTPEPPAQGAEAPPETQPEAPPATVEELAKKTVQSSGESIKKAGEAVTDSAKSAGGAVGNAAKKTWNCLSSFFTNC